MAELKRVFSAAKMNKDMDERVVPNGQYRDATNIEIATSEGSGVGTVQTLLGNTLRNNIDGGSYTTHEFSQNTTNLLGPHNKSTCIASIAAPDKDKIYYFVSGGDYSNTSGLHTLKKDYILQYDTVTDKTKYVFVDIYGSSTAVTTTTSTTVFYIALGAGETVNKTGIRVGMQLTSGSAQTLADGVEVSGIEYDGSEGKWKITTNIPNVLGDGDSVNFLAPRVLNFSKFKIITGINILDDFIFWTDNSTEPKKINISRSIAGTGGTVELANNVEAVFAGDYDYFHTRLVKDKASYNDIADRHKLVTNAAGTLPVYVNEPHVTVIRKAPTQPLELEMYRSSVRRVDDDGDETPITAVDTAFAYVEGAGENVNLVDIGDSIDVSFDADVDYRVGDILLISSSESALSPNSFTDYDIRAEVEVSNVTDPNFLDTDFTLRILSINPNLSTTNLTWYIKLEDKQPMFENRFPRFSYRYRYQDGEYSTFAPWSQIAFLPDNYEYHPKKGYNLGMVNQLRGVKLKYYYYNEETFPQDVVEIDLLYKEAGKPTVYTVKTLKQSDGGNEWPDLTNNSTARGEFDITTDMIHAVVPSNQLLRPWDNVPRKALAQEISANRLIYGNYLQNYTILEDPIISVTLDQDSLSGAGYDYAAPSVKSMRKYQVGVVFSDAYGRETPVLTSKKAAITVSKDASDTRNRLICQLKENTPNIPDWAEYFSYYVKETSVEYYTMAMDRWYSAADGNVWISFPSSERNKLDDETFLVLKKGHGNSTVVKDKARYRILSIKNEAPDFIKTEKKSLGKVYDNGNSVIGADNYGFPLQDTNFICIGKDEFEAAFGDQLHVLTPDKMSVRLYGQESRSNEYDVARLTLTTMDGPYKLQITGKFMEDVDFATTDGTYATAIPDLSLEIIEHKVENKPEFDGRFFVKILRDTTLENYVLKTQGLDDWLVSSRWKLGYINNNGYKYINPYTGSSIHNTETLGNQNLTAYNDVDSQGTTVAYDHADHVRHVTASGLHPTEGLHHTAAASDGGQEQNAYWWGDGNSSSAGGYNSGQTTMYSVSQEQVDRNPLYALGDATGNVDSVHGDAKKFWEAVRGKYMFFIDAATAFSWHGNTYNGAPGMAGDTSAFWDQNNLSSAAPEAQEYAPDGEYSNTKLNYSTVLQNGQPSRGIWGEEEDRSYMDISWSGLGNHSSDWGFDHNPPYNHKLSEFHEGWGGDTEGDNTEYYRANQFIRQLVEPGTKFRFARDPGKVVYKVLEDDFPTLRDADGGTGPGYNDNQVFKPGTNRYDGVWGIRNFRCEGSTGDGNNKDKNMYMPENLRQRWTLTISPQIGSVGPYYYSPTTGTGGYSFDASSDWSALDVDSPAAGEVNYRRALRHDLYGPYDAIEILSVFGGSEKGSFTENPGVWETEPKESVELDIYYQASGLIPLELNKKTNEELMPIGSTFWTVQEDPWGATEHTVTNWDNQTITFSPVVPAETTITTESEINFTKRRGYSLTAFTDGAVSVGANTMELHGGPSTNAAGHKLFSQKHYLDWSNCWCFGNGVESDRVRDDFNTAQVDNGVKASTVLAEQIREERRKHGLIWSGIYNSTSGINDTNQFIQAEKITKDLNPIYGSIQALANRDTRLVMFCEDKILRGVTNKDALYNADGNPQLVASNKVVGDVTPYKGDFGISTNPESLAMTPSTTYFADAMRGKVLALYENGIQSVSDVGMKDYFSDLMSANVWRCLGTYDERKKEYNLSLYTKSTDYQVIPTDQTTISYSELSKGWTSFKSFYPQHGVSLNNSYYTFSDGRLYEHHTSASHGDFYGIPYDADITILFNDQPEAVKSFKTLNYEGSQAKVIEFSSVNNQNYFTGDYSTDEGLVDTDSVTGANADGSATLAHEYYNLTAKDGWYADNLTTNLQTCAKVYFKNKEDKYFGYPTGELTALDNLDEREFSVQGIGIASITHNDNTQENEVTLTIANNITADYQGLDGTGDVWDDTATIATEISHWTCTSAQMIREGGSPVGAAANLSLTITPVANSNFPLSAANLKWSGATNTSGNTWDNDQTPPEANSDGGADIARVVFTDTGVAGDPNNTVDVVVSLNSAATWPTTDVTWYIDIDEVAGSATVNTREACVLTQYKFYDTGQTTPDVTNITGISEGTVDTGSYDTGFTDPTINSHSATDIADGETTLLASIDFVATAASPIYYYSTGSNYPTVSFENLGDYAGYYTGNIVDPVYSGGALTAFTAKVFYTPPQEGALIQDPDDMCALGHKAIINYSIFQNHTASDPDDITSVTHTSGINSGATTTGIKVYGESGATYKIWVERKDGVASTTTDKYYDFATNTFQANPSPNYGTGKISSSGMSTHQIALPPASVDTRYDIKLAALASETLAAAVPTADGDATIIHYGIKTLTITTAVDVAGDYGSMATQTVSRPSLFSGSNTSGVTPEFFTVTSGAAVSNSTKLVVAQGFKRIKQGMLLLIPFEGTGVPSGTTVVSTRRNNIVLSNNCTLPADTELTFVRDAGRLIPFSLTVSPGTSKAFTMKSSIDFQNSISGLSSTAQTYQNGVLGAHLAVVPCTDVSDVKVGMALSSPNATVNATTGYLKVTSIDTATPTVTVDTDQDSAYMGVGELLTFSWPEDDSTLDVYDEFGGGNTGVILTHIQAELDGDDLVVKGYLQVNDIRRTDTMNINIDDYVTVGAAP